MHLSSILSIKTVIICFVIFNPVQGYQLGHQQSSPSSPQPPPIASPLQHTLVTSTSLASSASIAPAATTTTASNTTSPTATATTFINQKATTKKICQGLHIRNDLKAFEALRNCNIIDGPLSIALVQNQTHPFQPEDYENLSFPHLYEITEYLLFFRVQGLTSLSKLFPNLSVIRGRTLVSDYALIIYEMTQLQTIDLPRLTDILRGSVRIENNPNLCYVSTINWVSICKRSLKPHFFRKNNERCNNRCPDYCLPWISKDTSVEQNAKLQGDFKELGSSNNKSLYCWNSKDCHNMCQTGVGLPLSFNGGGCCSPQCAGGCYIEDRSDQCVSCRSVSQEDKCVEQCDYSLYEYKGHCITKQACISMVEPTNHPSTGTNLTNGPYSQCPSTSKTLESTTISNFKAIRIPSQARGGVCTATCPGNYEEDPTNRNTCKPCDKGKCRKVCTPDENRVTKKRQYMITTVNSLRDVTGCTVINGSLEISSLKGGRNVMNELKLAFQDLEEITGFLKITRSQPILTLEFLRSLKVINGTELDRIDYSLVVIDNPNLQELFTFNKTIDNSSQKKLKILNGRIFFHVNPKLCLHEIEKLKEYAQVSGWDDTDVSPHSNGDKGACSKEKLQVEYSHGTNKVAMIKFENFAIKMNDPRSLLYYLVNYREVPSGTVSMFDGRDGCNSQNDLWVTEEVAPAIIPRRNTSEVLNQDGNNTRFQEYIIHIKPATRYALYVKTFTIQTGSTGALSDIIYFETAPDTPEMPRQPESQAISSSSISISWLPPSKPNGVIGHYYIIVTALNDSLGQIENTDICISTEGLTKVTSRLTDDEPEHSSLLPLSNSTTTASTTAKQQNGNSDENSMENNNCVKPNHDSKVEIQSEVVTFQDQMIEIVYIKQTCPVGGQSSRNLKRRSTDYDAINNVTPSSDLSIPSGKPVEHRNVAESDKVENEIAMAISSNNSASLQPSVRRYVLNPSPSGVYHIAFRDDIQRTEANLTVSRDYPQNARLSATVTNLQHFSMYQIQIMACHEDNYNRTNSRRSSSYKQCGMEVQTYVRTKPIEENDKVPFDSLQFSSANQTYEKNLVTWRRPDRPNGKVLAYRVRYKPRSNDSVHWTYVCINNTAYEQYSGIVLSSITPGNYLLSVQSLSLYSISQGDPIWSEPWLEFEIPDESSFSFLIGVILVPVIIIILSISLATALYYKKKNAGLVYASVNPDYIEYSPDEWEVDKSKLIIGKKIGTGSFGNVFKANFITDSGTSIPCAVKTVTASSTAKQRVDFLREASMMKQFDTYHVIKLLGVVSITTPVYVIMELMENGDLKNYLRNLRGPDQQSKKQHVDGIYLMAAQIADGMAYLSSKKFVHRDLAARNCMVGSNQVVKIGDFGLSRDMFGHDYYRRDTQGCLPVRWMSPESLKDNLYTTASDVWSYGVVVWEIVTWCEHPYSGLSNDQVVKQVIKGGFTLQRPPNCPEKLHNIMQKCWRKSKDRPTFIDIVNELLPFVQGEMSPDCFFFKQRLKETEGDNIAPDDTSKATPVFNSKESNNVAGVESYPLLSWPSTRANGMTNGVNHAQQQGEIPIP